MPGKQHSFQAEASKLLNLVTHYLYKNKEIFLRELISNASDACDKLRHLSLTKKELQSASSDYKIVVTSDKESKTLTVSDNGIGMSRQELINNLGTIAKSDTSSFLSKLTGDAKKDSNLIGQFGVGFYTAFMVASKVEVVSRKAEKEEAYIWSSEGKDSFFIEKTSREESGTTIKLYLKEDSSEYIEPYRLKSLVQKYSEHIAFPICLEDSGKEEQLNEERAIWTRPKTEIAEEQYKEFYKHTSNAYDEPWVTMHNKVEGVLEYTSLLFIPSSKPFDLMDSERKRRLKLYIKRVFITDDCQELLPSYLRFVRGIVDAEDLPLNVSRETLQLDPRMSRIKTTLTRKVLDELSKKSEESSEKYIEFWKNFGFILKEGLYEELSQQDLLLSLARFSTTKTEDLASLQEYIDKMEKDQKEIYYMLGENREDMLKSPKLEGFLDKGVNVILLTDPIDNYWITRVTTWKDYPLKSISEGDVELDKKSENSEKDSKDKKFEKLLEFFKKTLKDKVKDVRVSKRLKDSPVCLVNSVEGSFPSMVSPNRKKLQPSSQIFELNPSHSLILDMNSLVKKNGKIERIQDMANMLYDQALIVEGYPVMDAKQFSKRLTTLLGKELKLAS